MGWPLSQDYNEAIQNPLISLSDPDLKKGEVAVGPMGLPLPRSGNFADVYQMTGGGRKWAVKCFTRHVPGLQERYAKIDEHLRQAQLPFNVGFRFHEQGIRIRNEWFPIVKMEWVEGFTLNEFVRQHADRPAYLHALLGLWVRLCKRLREAKVAHADLQHGNVLLVPGSGANKLGLKLIDYDGMWVPALAKQPSGEAGHPAYQHPARLRDQVYSADVDRFPHLVIACALRATAVGGSKLWNEFDNGDNLLFRESDFANPGESKVAKALWALDDPTVTNLLSLMVLSTQHPLPKTPWLDEVLVGDQKGLLSNNVLARAAELIGVTRRSLRQAEPAAAVLVDDETNEFANIYEDGDAPRVYKAPQKRPPSLLPWVAGVSGVVAASLLGLIFLLKKPKASTEPVSNPEEIVAQTNNPTPAPVNKAPLALKHDWKPIQYGAKIDMPHSPGDWVNELTAKGRILQTIQQPNGNSLAVWFGPDDSHAILAHKTHVNIYDLKSRANDRTIVKDVGNLVKVTVSLDRKKLVSVGEDRVVRGWNIKDGTERWKHELPEGVDDLLISVDGKYVIAVGTELGYIEWELEDGKFVRSNPDFKADQIQWIEGGKRLLVRLGNEFHRWNRGTEVQRVVWDLTMKSSAVSADGKVAYSIGNGNNLAIWDFVASKPLPPLVPRPGQPPSTLAVNNKTILVGYESGENQQVHVDYGVVAGARSLRPGAAVTSLAISDDEQFALVGNAKGSVDLIRLTKPTGPSSPLVGDPKMPVPATGTFRAFQDLDTRSQLIGFDFLENSSKFIACSANKILLYDSKTKERLKEQSLDKNITYIRMLDADRALICQENSGAFSAQIWQFSTNSLSPNLQINLTDQVTRAIPVPQQPFLLLFLPNRGNWALYDTKNNRMHPNWPNTSNANLKVICATPSPDGKSIAFDQNQKSIGIWDCDQQKEVRSFATSAGINDIAFTPNGQKLIGKNEDNQFKVWNVADGSMEKYLESGVVNRLGPIKPINDQLFLSESRNNRVNLFDISKGSGTSFSQEDLFQDIPSVTGATFTLMPPWAIRKFQFSHLDAIKLDLAEQEAKLTPLMAAKPKPANPDILKEAELAIESTALDFSGDGKAILVGTEQGKLLRISTETLKIEKEAEGDTTEIIRLVATSGNRMVTLTRDWLRVWDATTLAKVREYKLTGAVDRATCLAIHPVQGSALVQTDKLRYLDTRDTRQFTFAIPPRIGKTAVLTQYAYSSDGKWGVARWDNQELGLWKPPTNVETKPLEHRVTVPQMPVTPTAIGISNDGKTVVMGGKENGTIFFWDAGGYRTSSAAGHFDRTGGTRLGVSEIVFLPNGIHFLSIGNDRQAILWDSSSYKKVKTFEVPEGAKKISVSPDQKYFALSSAGKVQLWKLPDLPKRK